MVLRRERQQWVEAHAERYVEWAGRIIDGPTSTLDKYEFAILSAHTPFARAVDGFARTRPLRGVAAGATAYGGSGGDAPHSDDVVALARELAAAGVLAPGNKAGAILALREGVADGSIVFPYRDYRAYRRATKLPGLGHCKLSFAMCLDDPIGADVVCLDTHMLQLLLERRPTPREVAKAYANLGWYEALEAQVCEEAAEVGLPPFIFQWAAWDWKRLVFNHIAPQKHDFLWQEGGTTQLPLFSSLS